MKKITQTITCILFVLFAGSMRSQMSGIYTVPGTYTSIGAAITDLNTQGVNGAVTINIAAGYTETVTVGGYTLNAIVGASAANQVTFQKSGSGANPLIYAYSGGTATPASALQDGIWRFNGTDYVTISGIDLTDLNTANPATMEYGYGFYKASVTDGCQNNTIKNCVVTLNRINSVTGSGASVEGSKAINVVNALLSGHTTALTITAASGSNSNNKFYSNTFQNCHVGIALIGYAGATPFTLCDFGNDVGGSSIATGNSILNFGGGGTTQCEAVTTLNQYNLNISYNLINNNNGSGVTHNGGLKGILVGTATSANTAINNNTLTLMTVNSTTALRVIDNSAGSTPANNYVTMNNNLITGCVFGTTSSGAFDALFNTGSSATISISGNTFSNTTINGTTASGGFIHNDGNATTLDFNYNVVDGYRYANASSGGFNFLYMSGAATTATLNIIGNTMQNMTNPLMVSTGYVMLHNEKPTMVTNFSNNTFNNLSLNTTGNVTFLENNVVYAAGSVQNVSGNGIVGTFNKTGGGGTVNFYTNTSAPGAGSIMTYSNNNFSNITLTGATTLGGWVSSGTGSGTRIITANTFTNITGGTSAITALNTNGNGNNSSITSNTISNITGGGAITGINYGSAGASTLSTLSGNMITALTSTAGVVTGMVTSAIATPLNVSNNVISALSTSAALATGLSVGGTGATNVFKNKIYDIQSNGTGGTVTGLLASAGSTCNIYNNIIGDLRTPAAQAANPLIGINVTGGTNMNLYYNTVYLNASSSSALFGCSGISASTGPALTLNNNIFANNSTASGAGVVSGYLRNSTTLTSYAASSNNNLFYAGIPSGNNAIFYDGTNKYISLAAYKAAMATRDQLAVTENPTFLSVTGSNNSFLMVNTTAATQIEAGGAPVSLVTDDYAGTVRNASTPDIGAFEGAYTPFSSCLTAPAANAALATSTLLCTNVTNFITLPVTSTVTGLSYQWEQATASSGPYSSISGATTTAYNSTVAAVPTWYRAVITCAAGGTSTSAPVMVQVGPAITAPAALTASALICPNQTSALSLTNSTGPAGLSYQWQVGSSSSGPYTAVPNATLTTLSATVGSTSWYQAVISCSASTSASIASAPVQVVTGTPSFTPVAAASATLICPNQSSTLTLTGASPSGLVYQWMVSPTGLAGSFTPLNTTTTSTTYTAANITSTSYFMSVSSCSSSASNSVASNVVQVTAGFPSATPTTVSTYTNICPAQTANLTLGTITGLGLGYQWQSASAAAGPYTSIANATTNATSTTAISASVWFQAIVSCTFSPSFSVTSVPVEIDPTQAVAYAPTPFLENFDGTWENRCDVKNVPKTAYWTSSPTTGNNSWRKQSDGATAGWSSPTTNTVAPLTGAGSANFHSYYANHTSGALSLYLNMTAASPNYSLSFYYKNPTGADSLEVFLSTNGGASSTKMAGYKVSAAWSKKVINLGAVNSSSCVITFSASSDYGADDIGMDSLEVKTCPIVIPVSTSSVICPGFTSTLSVTGDAYAYYWNTATTSSTVLPLTPASTSVYSVTGSNGLCAVTQTLAVTVSPTPTITISGSSGICTGQTATLNASGAASYTWNTGATTAQITDSPSTTTSYTVTGTSGLGCVSTASQAVTVAAGLNITILGPSAICLGQTANLTGNGGVTYTWSTGEMTSTLAPSPTVNTTYSITGASGTCSNSAVKTVSVNPNPTITVTGNFTTCAGSSTTLTANGGNTYTWSTNPTTSTLAVAPSTTTSYTVTGTNTIGCSSSTVVTVVTNTLPVITIASSSPTVCVNTSATLTASGATTYTWVNGPATASSVVTPTANTVYTVSGTANGCAAVKQATLFTYGLPTITIAPATPTICASTTLALTASGANTYTWSGGPSTAGYTVSPANSTTYTVTGTSTANCVSSKTVAVVTNTLPVVLVTAPASVTLCSLFTATFSASGATSYTWSNPASATTATVSVAPTVSTVYTVTGKNAANCISTATAAVVSLTLPALAITPANSTVCPFVPVTYTASGADTYTWTNSPSTASTAVFTTTNPTAYSVTATGVNGCTATTQANVTIYQLPTVYITNSALSLCALSPITFTAEGADTYSWSTAATGSIMTSSPAGPFTYTVTGTNTLTGCTDTETTTAIVNPLPLVAISPAATVVCRFSNVPLTASGADLYQWISNNNSPNVTINVTPSVTTTYSVKGTDALGCSQTASASITVNQLPVIAVTPGPTTICVNSSASFTASGAASYVWSPGSVNNAVLNVTPDAATVYTVTGTDANNCTGKAYVGVDVETCLGVKTAAFAGNAVSVYPNPSSGVFTARFDFEGSKTVMITNAVGQLITQTTTAAASETFDLSRLSKGVYFVKVSTTTASGNYKIVIE